MPSRSSDQPTEQSEMEAREMAQQGLMEQRRMDQQQQLAGQRYAIQVGNQELNALHQQAELEKQRVLIKRSIALQADRAGAFKELGGLNIDDPDLESNISALRVKYPAVNDDRAFETSVENLYKVAAAKQAAINRNIEQVMEFSKTHAVNPVYDPKTGIGDYDAMRKTAQGNLNVPSDFVPKGVRISSTGGETERFGPKAGESGVVREGAANRMAQLIGFLEGETIESLNTKLGDIDKKYNHTKPFDETGNAALIDQKKELDLKKQKAIELGVLQKYYSPQAQADQFEAGKIYTDKDGNKSKYKGGGEWEDQ